MQPNQNELIQSNAMSVYSLRQNLTLSWITAERFKVCVVNDERQSLSIMPAIEKMLSHDTDEAL